MKNYGIDIKVDKIEQILVVYYLQLKLNILPVQASLKQFFGSRVVNCFLKRRFEIHEPKLHFPICFAKNVIT